MNTLEAIATRRSGRRFAAKPVDDETMAKVIEAGRQAPSGGNCQFNHFIVIRNAGVLAGLAELVQAEFAKLEAGPDTYKSLAAAINASKKGTLTFHYGAPALVVVANKKGAGNAMADAACATENMLLAANELDLAACYVNQLHWLVGNDAVEDCLRGLGMADDEEVCCSLVLGHPDTGDGHLAHGERKITGNVVTYCD